MSRRTGRGVSALGNPRDADVCGKSRPSRPSRACRRFRFECLLLGELESGLQHTHGRIRTIGMSPLRWRAVRRQDDKSDRGTPAAEQSRLGDREVGGRRRLLSPSRGCGSEPPTTETSPPRPERNPTSTFWLVYGRERGRALPSGWVSYLSPLHVHLPGASQPTSRAGPRRLRAEPRRDWARR